MKMLKISALKSAIVASLSYILVCPQTEFQNKSNTWTDKDQKVYQTATARCGQLHPDAPCVKMFRKVEDGIYSVICGYKIREGDRGLR